LAILRIKLSQIDFFRYLLISRICAKFHRTLVSCILTHYQHIANTVRNIHVYIYIYICKLYIFTPHFR